MNSPRLHPKQFLYELKASMRPVIRAKNIDGKRQSDPGESHTDPLDQGFSLAGNEKDDQKAHHAAEKNGGKIREIGKFQIHLSTLRLDKWNGGIPECWGKNKKTRLLFHHSNIPLFQMR
jgi:hypothetical protein